MDMTRKKKKRIGLFDDIFGSSIFDEFEDFFSDFSGDIGSGFSGGYSIQVTYTDEGPVVYAELSDNVDANEFRKMLEQKYPGAKIVIKGGKQEEKFKVVKREKAGERVEVKLEDSAKQEEEKEEREESLFNMLYGGKKSFIRREDDT